MRKAFSLRNKNHDFNIERYKTRLTAKFCVIFVAVTQIILRLINVFTEKTLPTLTLILYCISLPLLGLMAGIVIAEYLVYRRIGPRILDYSKMIDVFLLIAFTAEWLVTLLFPLSRLAGTNPPALSVNSLYGMTSFSWRMLLLLFLIQSWKLLIIPPVLALGMIMGFAVHYSTMGLVFHFLRGIPQVVYVVMLLYFLDKIRWREVFTNVQQERWMQINDFILNNIPENIVILELGGQVRFVSEYCRSFMRKAHVSQNPNDLFVNIRDLNQQPDTEPSSPTDNESPRQTERLTTNGHLLIEPTDNNLINFQQIDDLQNLIANFKAIIRDAGLKEKQFLLYNGKLKVQDHPQKAIEIKISYIQQHNKEYIILIIRDTTQRDLLVTLEDNNKYKDQLLASVSHELRAPLNGNINLVESALQAVSVPENVKERMLTPALRSSKFLLHIINDILDMSQIKAQKLRLIFRSSSLRETLQDTLQLVELQARRKGLDLRLIIHPDLVESELCTDHMRLSQIVLNLLNNSIKFTRTGTVTLSAVPTEDPMCHKISIQDSGIGMNQEDMKKLFSDYTHIEFSGRAEINPTGVGLGLNIAYSLAKLLGPKDHNSITVESTPSIGSTFSFLIENREDQQQLESQDLLAGKKPISEKSQGIIPDEYLVIEPKIITRTCRSFSTNLILKNNEKQSPKELQQEECKCAKILVVDDNPFNTMAFEAVLGSLNYKCDAVFDGQSAIDKILKRQEKLCGNNCKPYNVIFMDQEMPGMTGSETVCKIKILQAQSQVPPMKIIGCTAHGCAREVEKFMESGIDSCIHKPITPQELQKLLEICDEN